MKTVFNNIMACILPIMAIGLIVIGLSIITDSKYKEGKCLLRSARHEGYAVVLSDITLEPSDTTFFIHGYR